MKRLYVTVLSYFLLLHVWGPAVFYILFGFFRQYESSLPEAYIYKTAVLISIPILVAILIISLIPRGEGRIQANDDAPLWYYIFGMGINMVFLFIQGDYQNALSGLMAGTLWAYLRIFFDTGCLLALFLLFQKRKKGFFLVCGLFLLVSLMGKSRSAALQAFFVLICMITSFESFKYHKKQIVTCLLMLLVIGPVIFMYAGNDRGIATNKSNMVQRVVGRFSILEAAGEAVYQKDEGLYLEDLSKEKYSAGNQFEQIINSTFPGSVFSQDVDPNQYYRAIFFGMPVNEVPKNYTSIFLSLPAYFYLKYSVVAALSVPIVIIVGLFLICSRNPNNKLAVIISAYPLYFMLQLFDWVMMFHLVLAVSLTLLCYQIILLAYKFIKLRNIPFAQKKGVLAPYCCDLFNCVGGEQPQRNSLLPCAVQNKTNYINYDGGFRSDIIKSDV